MSVDVVQEPSFDISDNFVPRNNDELVKAYGPYVSKLVMRHNRIMTNYKDLVQHIWLKLIEADVLGKYHRSLGHLPKTLTARQACNYLCMPWYDFMRRVHDGVKTECRYNRVHLRDNGQCHRCSTNGVQVTESLKMLRSTSPDTYPESVAKICARLRLEDLPERLWVVEVVGGKETTTCLFCTRTLRISGVSYRWYPTPQKGHWTHPLAPYNREDIERLRLVLETETDRPVDLEADPSSVLSKSLFKQYLARAVHNSYANWCRTRARRYQETYKGYDETTGRHWEDTLGDTFGVSQEVMCDLNTSVRYLAGGGSPDGSSVESEAEVVRLIESGKSIQEIARRKGVRLKHLQS
jgi:DNA-directed RNA polymerase specialized sigma24 family protein